MVFAELHGKLGSDGERAHPRCEDLLTSTAFGLLRYLSFAKGIGALLARARTARMEGERFKLDVGPPRWLESGAFERADVEFWPRLGDGREPDLRLALAGRKQPAAHTVLIEVKLYSAKSQREGHSGLPDDADSDPPALEKDQLAGYWAEQLKQQADPKDLTIIYLTRHATPPVRELEESLRPGMDLAWLSWFDVWAVARAAQDDLPAKDLSALLRSKGLSGFDGFRTEGWHRPGRGAFWRLIGASGTSAILRPEHWRSGRFFTPKESTP